MQRLFFLIWAVSLLARPTSEQRAAGLKALSYLELEGEERILDVGCGDGFLTSLLAEKVPFGSALGIDLSPSKIAFASSHFTSSRLKFRQLDAHLLDYEEEFDLVISFTALAEQLPILQKMERALRPGGKVIFEIANPCCSTEYLYLLQRAGLELVRIEQFFDAGEIPTRCLRVEAIKPLAIP